MKPSLPQKLVLLNFTSVLIGLLTGVLSNIAFDVFGNNHAVSKSLLAWTIIGFAIFAMIFFWLLLLETDAEEIFQEILDERKVDLRAKTMATQVKVAKHQATATIYTEIEVAAKRGELDKVKQLTEIVDIKGNS